MGILVIKTGILVGAQNGADQDGYLGYQDGCLGRGAERSGSRWGSWLSRRVSWSGRRTERIKMGILVGAQNGADQDGYLGYQDGDLGRGARRSVESLDFKTRRKSKHNKLEKIYLVAIIIKTRSRRT